MLRCASCLLVLATSALAQGNDELCRITAGIAGAAVTERANGASQERAILAVSADLDGDAASYAAAVQPIVAWVYTLPEEQLTDEVAEAYEAACLEQ